MTELSGSLVGVGLPAVVRFLAGLNKTGCLRIAQESWRGEVFFEAGQVCGATFGARRGLSALDGLVQGLREANFEFESNVITTADSTADSRVAVSHDVLLAHLDEVSGRGSEPSPTLPSLDAIPEVLAYDDDRLADEQLALDRGTLLTLVLVDGQRTVHEILTQRGSFEALWQVAQLVEVGLVSVKDAAAVTSRPVEEQPVEHGTQQADEAQEAQDTQDTQDSVAEPQAVHRCHKLGFEDDPANSFGRPTRLHRCFAAGAVLPLSLDQQRELCLSDQYGTCPRLVSFNTGNTGNQTPAADAVATLPETRDPDPEDARIVRLPFHARQKAAQSADVDHNARQAVGGSAKPARFRPLASRAAAARPHGGVTPLRTRAERSASTGVVSSTPASPAEATGNAAAVADRPIPPLGVRPDAEIGAVPTVALARRVVEPTMVASGRARWIGMAATGAVVLSVVAVIGYLLLPRMGEVLSDEVVDPAALPNTSAIAAGTPISQLTGAASRTGKDAVSTPVAAPPEVAGAGAAANAAGAASQPTLAARPTVAAEPTIAAQPTLEADPTLLHGAQTILDEDFADGHGWPTDPRGNATLANGMYRLATTQSGQFVAVGAPLVDALGDVIVSARFHKLGGPPGGGYGIILRDQSVGARDGTNQDGRYYVLEVGDRGEIGMWRRDGDHWVDLLPWQKTDAVKGGAAVNEVTARASGSRLSLSVDGTQVAVRTDATYSSGGVGLFVGGDGNQVAVDHITVQVP